MKRTDKKGFTIVELVIVIAVIAILAAVLIPNISRLVQKANASADESLVRNLNTALSMDVEKHTTMSAALKAAKDNGGYDLETIELKGKGNKILWDSVNDCFVYLNGTDRVYLPNTQSVKKADEMEKYEYFEILEKMPEDMSKQEYSIYLAGKEDIGDVKVTVGFDAGENKASKVTLNTAKKTAENSSFLINTNGGELVVKADNAAVEHYGEATIVTIEAVAMNSYHENGTVNEIKLAQGRVVVEAKADVGSVLVTAKSNTKAKVEVKASANLGAIGADNTDIKLSEIVIGAENTEIMDTPVTNTGFAGGFGTEKAPYLIATAEQFAKINELYSSVEYLPSFQTLSKYEGKVYHFAQIANISVSAVAGNNYILKAFTGEYDGNNYVLTLKDHASPETRYSLFNSIFGKVVLKNMNVNFENGATYTLIAINDFSGNNGLLEAELNNITVDSDMTVSANSGIYGIFWSNYAQSFKSIKFIKCINNVNVSNAGTTTGVYTGSGWEIENQKASDVSVIFENCENHGNITGKNQAGIIYGHRNYAEANDFYSYVTVNNVKNDGYIKVLDRDGCARFAPLFEKFIGTEKDRFASYTEENRSLYSVVENVFDGDSIVVVDIVNKQIHTNVTAAKFKISFRIATIHIGDNVSNTTEYAFDLTVDATTTSNIVKVTARNSAENEQLEYNEQGFCLVKNADGSISLVFQKEEGRTFGENDMGSAVTVVVKAFDSTGVLIGTKEVK